MANKFVQMNVKSETREVFDDIVKLMSKQLGVSVNLYDAVHTAAIELRDRLDDKEGILHV